MSPASQEPMAPALAARGGPHSLPSSGPWREIDPDAQRCGGDQATDRRVPLVGQPSGSGIGVIVGEQVSDPGVPLAVREHSDVGRVFDVADPVSLVPVGGDHPEGVADESVADAGASWPARPPTDRFHHRERIGGDGVFELPAKHRVAQYQPAGEDPVLSGPLGAGEMSHRLTLLPRHISVPERAFAHECRSGAVADQRRPDARQRMSGLRVPCRSGARHAAWVGGRRRCPMSPGGSVSDREDNDV